MTKKEIKEVLFKELREAFDFEESGVQERIIIDYKKKEVTIKFNFKIEEDLIIFE